MTRWFRAVRDADGYEEYPAAADEEELPGGDWTGWTLTEIDGEKGEYDLVEENGAVVVDLTKVETFALNRLDDGQDAAEQGEGRSTRIRSMLFAWYELQDLKTLAPAAAEGTLWPVVKRIAVFEAKGELRRRDIRQAPTAEEKLAAAEGVDWMDQSAQPQGIQKPGGG